MYHHDLIKIGRALITDLRAEFKKSLSLIKENNKYFAVNNYTKVKVKISKKKAQELEKFLNN